MNWDSLWHRIKNKPLLSLIGGFAIAGVAIGILVLLILLWVEPMSAPERAGTVRFDVDHFNLWYQKDGTGIANHRALSDDLQRDLNDLVKLLQVDPDLIPDPIDVFIHDDINAMQTSIAKRKDPESRGGYIAPLDLLVGESPRRRLAELVLAFGWGQCGSSLLKHGVALYASDPQRNFHAVIAALPQKLYYSLPELIVMEKRGKWSETLYEQFDSPYCPASIQFADLRNLLGLSVQGEASPEDIPALEAASFVQFLIETKGGIGSVKQAWGRGSTKDLLRRIDSASLAEIGVRWYATGIEEGRSGSDFPFLSVYYLLGGGFPDTAWIKCSTWHVQDLSQDEISLAARCAIAVGAFPESKALAYHLGEGENADEVRSLLALYDGWKMRETAGLRILISPQVASDAWTDLSEVKGVFERMVEKLALAPDDLPERMTLFFYPDQQIRDRGESLIPLSSAKNGTLSLIPGNDTSYQMAEVLPVYAWGKDTYSRLLREGLAMALSSDPDILVEKGRRLRHEGRWFPLASVDYGMTAQETVKTEAGLLVDYLLDTYGGEALREVWVATSPLDRYLSFDTALAEVCATTREEIEETLFSSLLSLNN